MTPKFEGVFEQRNIFSNYNNDELSYDVIPMLLYDNEHLKISQLIKRRPEATKMRFYRKIHRIK